MDAKLRYGAGFACGKCGTSASDAATGSQPIQTPCSLLSTPMQFLSAWNKEMRLPQEGWWLYSFWDLGSGHVFG